jgi:hypothetical protein
MRAGGIFNLTWDRISLKDKVIRLQAEDTKTSEPRLIILDGKLLDIVLEAHKGRALGHNQVFTYKRRTVKRIRKAFLNACKQAGITNFRFHDLRHTFNTNMRKGLWLLAICFPPFILSHKSLTPSPPLKKGMENTAPVAVDTPRPEPAGEGVAQAAESGEDPNPVNSVKMVNSRHKGNNNREIFFQS